MALDASMIHFTARALEKQLYWARIDKIFMPTRDEVVLALRTEAGPQRLFISARSGASRIHLTQENFEAPAVPPGFCMLLRKYLASGRITGVRTVDGERILFVDFDALNEMGDRVKVTLSVEVMGRYSNLVLVNEEGRVIDALKRIDAEQSDKRQLLPGIPFTMPPVQNKMPFLSTPTEAIINRVTVSEKSLSAALLEACAGVGPVVCREIAHRVDPIDPAADSLSSDKRTRLAETIENVKAAADGEGSVLSIVYDGEKPVEYSFIELTQYTGLAVKRFDNVNVLFDSYYLEKDRAERAKARSFDLTRQVNALYERGQRKLVARREELKNTEKADAKRLYGELLNANLHALEKGMRKAEVINYYTGEMVTIPLDVTKNPVQNAQKYYKEYRKLTTAARMLEGLIEQGERELVYLESVKYEITEARTEEDFLLIRKELKDAGYLRGFKYKEQKKARRMAEFLRYRTTDGKLVLVGRNNAANEKLSLKTAEKHDIWFHVKNAQGSHVILVTEKEEPSDRDYTEAAEIAALHSTQKNGEHVEVDYTLARNVKKAVGQKTGMVIYDKNFTAVVTPDEKKLSAMREK